MACRVYGVYRVYRGFLDFRVYRVQGLELLQFTGFRVLGPWMCRVYTHGPRFSETLKFPYW